MNFSIHILGSGAAIPLSHRNPSAQIVNVNSKLYLFDCAEGAQVQIRRNHLRLQKIDNIFITHLHGDHYYGLMGLITTMHLLGREEAVNIYAPQALEEIIRLHLEVSNTILRYPLHFHAVDTEISKVIFENKDVLVSSIPMLHNFPTCGYLIREQQHKPNIRREFLEGKALTNADFRKIKDGEDYTDANGNIFKNTDITHPPKPSRAYAYCTDTAYNEAIIPLIEGVDLLYHEATFMEDKLKDAEAKFHSTAAQAAAIAKKAGVRKLLLGHYSARYTDLDGLLGEARAVFPESYLTVDGLSVDL